MHICFGKHSHRQDSAATGETGFSSMAAVITDSRSLTGGKPFMIALQAGGW
jgi:hypothetical protein